MTQELLWLFCKTGFCIWEVLGKVAYQQSRARERALSVYFTCYDQVIECVYGINPYHVIDAMRNKEAWAQALKLMACICLIEHHLQNCEIVQVCCFGVISQLRETEITGNSYSNCAQHSSRRSNHMPFDCTQAWTSAQFMRSFLGLRQ
jgi:hypothetical protein